MRREPQPITFQIPSTFGEHRISILLPEVNKKVPSTVSTKEIPSQKGPVAKIPFAPHSIQEVSTQAQQILTVTFQFTGHP